MEPLPIPMTALEWLTTIGGAPPPPLLIPSPQDQSDRNGKK